MDTIPSFIPPFLQIRSWNFWFVLWKGKASTSVFFTHETLSVPCLSFPLACAFYRSFSAFRYIGHFGELFLFSSPWWALGFCASFFNPFGDTLYTSIRVCSASDILSFSSFLPSTPLQSRSELKKFASQSASFFSISFRSSSLPRKFCHRDVMHLMIPFSHTRLFFRLVISFGYTSSFGVLYLLSTHLFGCLRSILL